MLKNHSKCLAQTGELLSTLARFYDTLIYFIKKKNDALTSVSNLVNTTLEYAHHLLEGQDFWRKIV